MLYGLIADTKDGTSFFDSAQNIYAPDDDSYAVVVISENSGQLYVTAEYECWARSATSIYSNGVIDPLLKFSQCIGFAFLYHGIRVVHFRKTAADGCRYFISQKLFIQGSGGRCCICGIRFGCAFCLRLIISGLIVCCGSILTSKGAEQSTDRDC